MTEELLKYYNQELAFLRRMGAEFAAAHPKIAGRLRLGTDSVEDPHVERLIQSAAFLNARTRCKLEDDFPELTDAFLGILYPHYLAPIPSMAVVAFEPAADAEEVHRIARGSFVETAREHGEPCRYRTCYDVDLLPLEVAHAGLEAAPFRAPATPAAPSAQAVLKLTLRTLSEAVRIADLDLGRIRLFLGGQSTDSLASYEMLLNDVVEIAVATSDRDRRPQLLSPDAVRPVGFGDDEAVIPCPGRSQPAYRLLTEYFTFPAKFLFLDVVGLDGAASKRAERELTIYFFLRRSSAELQRSLSKSSFVLGCSPVVNLFPKRAEPVRLEAGASEVPVVPDARRPQSVEVHSVDAVSMVDPSGARRAYRPFFGLEHGPAGGGGDAGEAYYHPVRRQAAASGASGASLGTDVALRFLDDGGRDAAARDSVVTVEATCLNRDLPAKLPFGPDEPRMELVDSGVPLERVRCLTAPTRTIRPAAGRAASWRLISHLALNHQSIVGGEEGGVALRELLRLYDFVADPTTSGVIDSIVGVSSRRAAMRVSSGGMAGFARGTEVRLELDEKRFGDRGLFLFASVLEAFFGLYCSVNSFVRLTVVTDARTGALRRWPPRSGTRVLV